MLPCAGCPDEYTSGSRIGEVKVFMMGDYFFTNPINADQKTEEKAESPDVSASTPSVRIMEEQLDEVHRLRAASSE